MGNKKGNCRTEYALYKGDTFLDIGTAQFLSEKWGVRPSTIRWLANCKRNHEYNHKSGYASVSLGIPEEEM